MKVQIQGRACAAPQMEGASEAVSEQAGAVGRPGTTVVAQAAGARVAHALLTHPHACALRQAVRACHNRHMECQPSVHASSRKSMGTARPRLLLSGPPALSSRIHILCTRCFCI